MLAKTSLLFAATFAALPALAAECTAHSAATRTPLVELYTSEGCSSCPPADRWLSGLKGHDDAIALSWHVDYWDYIGWKDRFAEPRNSRRQRDKVSLAGGRTIYTPQIMVNGHDSRAWRGHDPLGSVERPAASARIALTMTPTTTGQTIRLQAEAPRERKTQLVVARYENGHQSSVKAGENRGETLKHDFVVRDWETRPMPTQGPLETEVRFLPGETRGGVVAFIEDLHSGDVLQTVALADCAP